MCFTHQEVKWLQGVVSLSVIYLLIEKKNEKFSISLRILWIKQNR